MAAHLGLDIGTSNVTLVPSARQAAVWQLHRAPSTHRTSISSALSRIPDTRKTPAAVCPRRLATFRPRPAQVAAYKNSRAQRSKLHHAAERDAGWRSPEANAVLAGQRSLAEVAGWALTQGLDPQPRSGRQEYLASLASRFV
jgi:hypothetical protein